MILLASLSATPSPRGCARHRPTASGNGEPGYLKCHRDPSPSKPAGDRCRLTLAGGTSEGPDDEDASGHPHDHLPPGVALL